MQGKIRHKMDAAFTIVKVATSELGCELIMRNVEYPRITLPRERKKSLRSRIL